MKKVGFVLACCLWVLSLAGFSLAAETAGMQLQSSATALTIDNGTQPVLVYRYKEVPFKPYVQSLYSPKGVNVLLDAPADHLHHHGLMFAVSAEGTSFWEESETGGKQNHAGFAGMQVTPERVQFAERLRWALPDGTLVLNEKRTIQVWNRPDLTFLSWRTELTIPKGRDKATLGGSHYYGLGMRFAPFMDRIGEFGNAAGSEGAIFRGLERLTGATWCAYRVPQEENPVTVVMFDHPSNYKPATWFTMPEPFAYLSATLRYHEEAIELQSGTPLSFLYGVVVQDGIMTTDQIEALYQTWIHTNPTKNGEEK